MYGGGLTLDYYFLKIVEIKVLIFNKLNCLARCLWLVRRCFEWVDKGSPTIHGDNLACDKR